MTLDKFIDQIYETFYRVSYVFNVEDFDIDEDKVLESLFDTTDEDYIEDELENDDKFYLKSLEKYVRGFFEDITSPSYYEMFGYCG